VRPSYAASPARKIIAGTARGRARRQEDTDNHVGTVTEYELAPDGKAALDRGEVAEVVARRLPG
jgi:hypothetical protein